MERAVIQLKKGEGRTLNAGGAWVYDNEIDKQPLDIAPGALVTVVAFNEYPLGIGFYNPNSKIRIRMLTRSVQERIDEAFFKKRVHDAVAYRVAVMGLTDMSSCRLVFGEADFLPGLTIDKFSDCLVVQSLALGMDPYKEMVIELLKEELLLLGMPIRGVYERSDAKVRLLEGLERKKGFLGQQFETEVEIVENNVRYLVDVEDGQKTGFFLDQKYNRRAIWKICENADRVLDCFTHTGSFALNAGMAGAKHVWGVDASMLAVEQATKNAKLNGLSDRVQFTCEDVFDLLPRLNEEKQLFDVVILDPPAFTKSRESVKNATKGYREINLKGIKLVKDGGFLATCSCSHFMTPELLEKTINEAARSAHKRLRQIEVRAQAPDHPVLWGSDASYYLKFYIFQVMDEK